MSKGFSRRIIARTVAAKLVAEPQRRAHWINALAGYLAEHRRTEEADLIVNDIAREMFQQNGDLLVRVTSSREMADHIRRELTQTLKADTGAKHVTLTEDVDRDLVGGFIAQTPDAVLDLSVRSQLQQLAAIK